MLSKAELEEIDSAFDENKRHKPRKQPHERLGQHIVIRVDLPTKQKLEAYCRINKTDVTKLTRMLYASLLDE